jgi:hypothetical protein
MKPSEKCKQAGLKSLAELVELYGRAERTLIDWDKNNPQQFDNAIRAAVMKKAERAIASWQV